MTATEMTTVSGGRVDADVSIGPISAPMIAALEAAWAAIRDRYPEVPPVVIVVGAGSLGTRGGLRLGHFAALRWHQGEQTALPEVFIGGEGLARGPAEVLATLLHEAAHALAHVRGIRDTSRQGRWHNARFKQLATELGIAVTKDPSLGWSPTLLTDESRAGYAETITELGAALRLHRRLEPTGTETTTKRPSQPACVCGCGRRIRVAPTVLAAGPITCGLCGTDFVPYEPYEEDPS